MADIADAARIIGNLGKCAYLGYLPQQSAHVKYFGSTAAPQQGQEFNVGINSNLSQDCSTLSNPTLCNSHPLIISISFNNAIEYHHPSDFQTRVTP